jgi:hypothetical protein
MSGSQSAKTGRVQYEFSLDKVPAGMDEHEIQVETGLRYRIRSNDLGGNVCTP